MIDENIADPDSEYSLNYRVFVGRSLQNNLNEGVPYGYDLHSKQTINLEIMGSVVYNDGWQLHVPHSSTVTELHQDFLVLCIDDPESFEWMNTTSSLIPRFALRACVDRLTNEYFYVGRAHTNHQPCPTPEHMNQMSWRPYKEILPYRFGKVHPSHRVLYVPFNKLELAFKCYDILCLKPSPSPLRILCRTRIRKLLDNSSKKIRLINTNRSGRRYVPDRVLASLDFPSSLSVGEYMLKDEKIIRQDGKYELKIQSNCDMIISPLIPDEDKLTPDELNQMKDTQVQHTLCMDVDSLWLHRFQVVCYKTNQRVKVIHSFYDTSPEYKLFIDNSDPPNIQVSAD